MADTDARPVSQDGLVADIHRTRADLARTIDAISDRVSPKRNVNRAMGEVRQRVNQIGQRANQVGERVGQQVGERASKVDPVIVGAAGAAPAVLVGGTVLFLVRRRRHQPPRRSALSLRSWLARRTPRRTAGRSAAPGPRCRPGRRGPGTASQPRMVRR